jgi:hypothetical protein
MLELRNETLLTLRQAAHIFPPNAKGRPVALSTVFRWIVDGVRNHRGDTVRLEAFRIAGKWLTSHEAIQRFVDRQTPAFGDPAPQIRTPGVRSRAAAKAAQELSTAGV